MKTYIDPLVNKNAFASKAKELGIKPTSKRRWLLADEILVRPNPFGVEPNQFYRVLKPGSISLQNYPLDQEVYRDPNIQDRLRQVGHFNINNNVIAFVDENGDLYSAPCDSERINSLRLAGYSHLDSQFPVPFSNWERPADPLLCKKFVKWAIRARDTISKPQYTQEYAQKVDALDAPFRFANQMIEMLYRGRQK